MVVVVIVARVAKVSLRQTVWLVVAYLSHDSTPNVVIVHAWGSIHARLAAWATTGEQTCEAIVEDLHALAQFRTLLLLKYQAECADLLETLPCEVPRVRSVGHGGAWLLYACIYPFVKLVFSFLLQLLSLVLSWPGLRQHKTQSFDGRHIELHIPDVSQYWMHKPFCKSSDLSHTRRLNRSTH
jgi:hypothetical protein